MGDSAADERSVAVSGLLAGTQYAFEVRAVNSGGRKHRGRAGNGITGVAQLLVGAGPGGHGSDGSLDGDDDDRGERSLGYTR